MHLQVVIGRERGRVYALSFGSYALGRESACDVQLVSDIVSRRHARLEVSNQGVKVADLGSSNGTYVNGARVLGEGIVNIGTDLLLVGDVAMRLHVGTPPQLNEYVNRGPVDPEQPMSANLAGTLIEIPPATVLRYLAVIKKTGELILTSPPLQGRVMFTRGHISEVLVDMRKTRDPIQALTAILRWKGMFEIGPPGDGASSLLLGLDALLPPVGTGARPSMIPPRR
jgi:hypothetical protein